MSAMHILAKTFRKLYTRDTISPETVKNLDQCLQIAKEYQERYVEMLQKVTYNIITLLTRCIVYSKFCSDCIVQIKYRLQNMY